MVLMADQHSILYLIASHMIPSMINGRALEGTTKTTTHIPPPLDTHTSQGVCIAVAQ